MNRYRLFSVQSSKRLPSMYQNFNGYRRFCMQNDLSPEQMFVQLEDYSIGSTRMSEHSEWGLGLMECGVFLAR